MQANPRSLCLMSLVRTSTRSINWSVSSAVTSIVTSRLVPTIASALLSCLPQASLAEQQDETDREFLGWYLRYADDSGGVFDPLDLEDANWLEQVESFTEPVGTTGETPTGNPALRNKEVVTP